jgi:proteasome lid subunit RPN8/RPN11
MCELECRKTAVFLEVILISLPNSFVTEMIQHSLEYDPIECCGIIAGTKTEAIKLYRMTNTEQSPYRYNMDGKELFQVYQEIEDNGWEILALYHSHTHSEGRPSATDIRLATWPEAYYILISLLDKEQPTVRAFTIINGNVEEQKLTLLE